MNRTPPELPPAPGPVAAAGVCRLRAHLRGAVQGVGFRPFAHRLATELGLTGWVGNSNAGVELEIEGPRSILLAFLRRLETEKPPRCAIHGLEYWWLDPVGCRGFEIRPSQAGQNPTALILPDIATCPECLSEIFDPADRRYGYPFTNCTHCGPRFSIIRSLPYDRANTAMAGFEMCPRCAAEYGDPADRRFHAQPNACPDCGPHLELWDRTGRRVAGQPGDSQANRCVILAACAAIRDGQIVAVKGLGGFHLLVDAGRDPAVDLLRARKEREEKPFAVMFPSLAAVRAACELSSLEARLLGSPESPIVILRRLSPDGRTGDAAATGVGRRVAPGNPNLGALLPYTPLHHLLLAELKTAVVATSGNLSDEPICTDECEVVRRLGAIADLFLVHNRPIARHVDDSIVRVVADRELVLRRARGFAPLPVPLSDAPGNRSTVIAFGAHLKNTVALGLGTQAFVSQHIGDLETDPAWEAFRRVIEDFESLYAVAPEVVAADAHPDYLSTAFARSRTQDNPAATRPGQTRPRLVTVQHHVAHSLACLAENDVAPPALGIAWDGTGYGLDGTIWGGEFFSIESGTEKRVAHLRTFQLPGGEAAVKEPRRAALGLLYAAFGPEALGRTDLLPVASFTAPERKTLAAMLAGGINSPSTSSVGRLFDAVGAIVGLRQVARFEGQAAMELEFAAETVETVETYPVLVQPPAQPAGPRILDWGPMLQMILQDLRDLSPERIAAKFHNTLAEAAVSVARIAGLEKVLLSGGCFQNRTLTERTIERLARAGFRVYWHQRIPPNDGGISLGQIVAARRRAV